MKCLRVYPANHVLQVERTLIQPLDFFAPTTDVTARFIGDGRDSEWLESWAWAPVATAGLIGARLLAPAATAGRGSDMPCLDVDGSSAPHDDLSDSSEGGER